MCGVFGGGKEIAAVLADTGGGNVTEGVISTGPADGALGGGALAARKFNPIRINASIRSLEMKNDKFL
jgi:hypothetical protein